MVFVVKQPAVRAMLLAAIERMRRERTRSTQRSTVWAGPPVALAQPKASSIRLQFLIDGAIPSAGWRDHLPI